MGRTGACLSPANVAAVPVKGCKLSLQWEADRAVAGRQLSFMWEKILIIQMSYYLQFFFNSVEDLTRKTCIYYSEKNSASVFPHSQPTSTTFGLTDSL